VETYLGRFRYKASHGGRGGNLKRFYELLLFLFGILSLIPGVMQVGLLALPDLKSSPSWLGFGQVCSWIAVVCIVLMALLLLVMPLQYGLVRLSKAVIGVVDSISRNAQRTAPIKHSRRGCTWS
jgi:hypothetical protein